MSKARWTRHLQLLSLLIITRWFVRRCDRSSPTEVLILAFLAAKEVQPPEVLRCVSHLRDKRYCILPSTDERAMVPPTRTIAKAHSLEGALGCKYSVKAVISIA
jgi:hypothetical protein